MKKRQMIFIFFAFIFIIILSIISILVLFRGGISNPEPTITPTETQPTWFDEDEVTIPSGEINNQISEIEKHGFPEKTKYWIEKLKEAVGGEAELNALLNEGFTLEQLCRKHFPEEYQDYNSAFLLGDEKLPEFPKDENEALYNRLIKLAHENNFSDMLYEIEILLSQYKFTEAYNYNIGNLYHDASIAFDLNNMDEAARVKAIGKFKDPVMMFMLAVQQVTHAQCAMITSNHSLYFYSGTFINVQKIETYTISPDAEDVDGRLMNRYFNHGTGELKVVKLTFTIDFDKSGYTPDSFYPYFEKVTPPLPEYYIYVYGENGEILYDLTYFTQEEISLFMQEHPDLTLSYIPTAPQTEEDTTTPTNNSTSSGRASAQEPIVDEDAYDMEAFNLFKETVFEVYLPVYSIYTGNYNRIYKIQQVTNLNMPYFRTKSEFIDVAIPNVLQFIRDNQWAYIQQSN